MDRPSDRGSISCVEMLSQPAAHRVNGRGTKGDQVPVAEVSKPMGVNAPFHLEKQSPPGPRKRVNQLI